MSLSTGQFGYNPHVKAAAEAIDRQRQMGLDLSEPGLAHIPAAGHGAVFPSIDAPYNPHAEHFGMTPDPWLIDSRPYRQAAGPNFRESMAVTNFPDEMGRIHKFVSNVRDDRSGLSSQVDFMPDAGLPIGDFTTMDQRDSSLYVPTPATLYTGPEAMMHAMDAQEAAKRSEDDPAGRIGNPTVNTADPEEFLETVRSNTTDRRPAHPDSLRANQEALRGMAPFLRDPMIQVRSINTTRAGDSKAVYWDRRQGTLSI